MIDVHCHLTEHALASNLDQVLEEARKTGITHLITSGTSYEDDLRVLEVADNKYVSASLGLMPYYNEDPEKVVELIKVSRDKIVAVGEVGLDYYLGNAGDRERQIKVFTLMIETARDLDLPLVIHSRSAGKYAIDLLIKHGVEKAVMHAFDGSVGHAMRGAEKGYFFSIPPSVIRSEQKQKLVKRLKLENLLLESDAPSLGPEKGVINHPKNIALSAQFIARLKNISLDKVVEATTESALRLFKINR